MVSSEGALCSWTPPFKLDPGESRCGSLDADATCVVRDSEAVL